ncbi:hypothetical protein BU16DRAFT_562235 [Lophium mytilinum]|uniref:Uncharacterized protein n=1 Tax=Lophium mytilinum TaxID=390894 RepID=A0A6A6QS41_9PEZI|nr:hypothetical protein BU16DRAFT_562235 [Lophium mytilinum]
MSSSSHPNDHASKSGHHQGNQKASITVEGPMGLVLTMQFAWESRADYEGEQSRLETQQAAIDVQLQHHKWALFLNKKMLESLGKDLDYALSMGWVPPALLDRMEAINVKVAGQEQSKQKLQLEYCKLGEKIRLARSQWEEFQLKANAGLTEIFARLTLGADQLPSDIATPALDEQQQPTEKDEFPDSAFAQQESIGSENSNEKTQATQDVYDEHADDSDDWEDI